MRASDDLHEQGMRLVRAFAAPLLLAPLCLCPSWAHAEDPAAESVTVAAESASDGPFERKGLFFGVDVAGGGSLFNQDGKTETLPDELDPGDNLARATPHPTRSGAIQLGVVIGGALTPRLTLAVHAKLVPYLPHPYGAIGFGGDLELTGFVHKGLFLRAAPGALTVQKIDRSGEYTAAPGGFAGIGHQWRFEKNHTALDAIAGYDFRWSLADSDPRHTALVGLRVSWY